MTFLTTLFSSKKNAPFTNNSIQEHAPVSYSNEVITEDLIFENTKTETNTMTEQYQDNSEFRDLFLDNKPPIADNKVAEAKPGKLEVFLNRNYLSMGINEGFEYHSNETLKIAKSRIKAEFQLIVDQAINTKVSIQLEFKNKLVDVNMIPEISQKIENTLHALDASIESLKLQKELATENEGWVMTALHSYHQGFMLGINDWLSGEQLLSSIHTI